MLRCVGFWYVLTVRLFEMLINKSIMIDEQVDIFDLLNDNILNCNRILENK